MFTLIFGIVTTLLMTGVGIYEAVKSKKDAEAAASIKRQVREKAKGITNQIMKNSALKEKLVTTYQAKGAREARDLLMQSPFGSNIKTIQQQLSKTVSDFNNANDALAKEDQELQSKQNQLDRISADTYNTETAADSQAELNRQDWKPTSTASDAIANHLSNMNKPLEPKPTTTAPTQQVMGGLKGASS